MASRSFSLDDQNENQENQEQKQSLHRGRSLESVFSEGYVSSPDDSLPLSGSVKRRPHLCKCKTGEDRRGLTEEDATEICKYIGRHWRPLGRKLNYLEAELDSISDHKSNDSYEDKAHALLIKFIRQQGCDATKGKLAEALFSIGRRDVAEKLVGTQHFASKTPDQQIFFLKEEGSFDVPDEDNQPVSFFACRNIDNGRLYLVRELVGTGYEESCKTLKQQDTIADSILKTLDVKGIVKAEKQKKEKQRFKEAQDEIVELLKGLQEIVNSLEKQERKEKRIQVWQQLLEDEVLLGEMQRLGTGLIQLTGRVSHFEDPFPLQAQMYSFSLGLSAILRDLEERVKMLREMVPSAKKLLGKIETEKFDELLNRSRSLGKAIKMRENVLIRHVKEAAPLENQQRPRHGQHCSSSDPLPKSSSYPVDITEIRRAGTQPVSKDEFRTLAEQVAPAPDPMEEEGSFC